MACHALAKSNFAAANRSLALASLIAVPHRSNIGSPKSLGTVTIQRQRSGLAGSRSADAQTMGWMFRDVMAATQEAQNALHWVAARPVNSPPLVVPPGAVATTIFRPLRNGGNCNWWTERTFWMLGTFLPRPAERGPGAWRRIAIVPIAVAPTFPANPSSNHCICSVSTSIPPTLPNKVRAEAQTMAQVHGFALRI